MNTREERSDRVLFVDHAGVLGGAELSLLDVVAAMGPRAGTVLLADGLFRAALEERGVSVSVEEIGAFKHVKKESTFPTPAALVDAFALARRVGRRARDYGVICANSQKAFVVACAAGLFARRPVAWYLRDILALPHFSRTNIAAAVRLANLRAARVIANSDATAQAFIDAGGNAELVRVVHNGIDAAPFDAVTESAAYALRTSLGIPADAFVVALFGRFHPWKGQQVLLQALAELPDVHALFVGAALFGEEAFEASLHDQATHSGGAPHVHFLGFRRDVPTLMRVADVVVHASVLPEPFGRVVVEGMLARRPVIATRGGGVTEIAEDDVTALLVPPDDAAALAAAIQRLRSNPALAGRLAAAGQAHARERFTVTSMVQGVENALAGLGR
jgi:glycosyltransferase involved in cell wall biosynthesis